MKAFNILIWGLLTLTLRSTGWMVLWNLYASEVLGVRTLGFWEAACFVVMIRMATS